MTIYDIAKLAGVSKSTVSRVINDNGSVDPKVKKKIEKIIKYNNYIPNKSAATTKSKIKTYLMLVTRLDSYSENRLIRGMMQADDPKSEFIIMETKFSITETKKMIKNNKNVNAIIVFANSGEDYKFLDNSLVPIVLVGQKLETTNSNVYFPDYQAVKTLIATDKNKYQTPIFIGLDKNDKTKKLRYQAVVDTYQENVTSVLEEGYEQTINPQIEQIIFRNYDYIICATDKIALQVYRQLLSQNHKNYQIAAIGNNHQINFIIGGLKTINYQYKSLGTQIIKKLQDQQKFTIKAEYEIITIK